MPGLAWIKLSKLRKNAEICSEVAHTAAIEPAKRRFQADGWKVVAENPVWLDGQRDTSTNKAS